MHKLKVRKFGNSLGVILPKEVLSKLETGCGGELFLTEASGGEYRLGPYDPKFEEKMAMLKEIVSDYRNTLRELAK